MAQGSGQPVLGKEYWGLGGLLSRKDSRPVRKGLWPEFVALNFKAGTVTEKKA